MTVEEIVSRWIRETREITIPAMEVSRPVPVIAEFKHLGEVANRVYRRNRGRWERQAEREAELKIRGIWNKAAEASVWSWYDVQLAKEKAAP